MNTQHLLNLYYELLTLFEGKANSKELAAYLIYRVCAPLGISEADLAAGFGLQPGQLTALGYRPDLAQGSTSFQQVLDAIRPKRYAIGDTGPNGGIVFKLNEAKTAGIECKLADERNGGNKTFNWQEAQQLSKDDWVVPDKHTLNSLYLVKDKIPGLMNNSIDYKVYWSSTSVDDTTAIYQYFSSGSQTNLVKTYKASVRLVKTF